MWYVLINNYFPMTFQYYRNQLNVCLAVILEKRMGSQLKSDCCYDIPLHHSLQALLRIDIVREQVYKLDYVIFCMIFNTHTIMIDR